MQEATLKLLTGQDSGILNLATPQAFGARWLIPRLERFHRANPDIMISLVTRNVIFDFAAEPLDAAIHYGNNDWPGVAATRLHGDVVVLVGAPSYLRQLPPFRSPQDVQGAVLLQPIRRPQVWHDWLTVADVRGVNAWAGPRFEHYYMIIQAAVAGLGLAILPHILVADELRSGRLENPLGLEFAIEDSYYLVHPEHKGRDRRVRVLRDWLVAESAR